jgi:hypothetical protein
MQAARTRCPVIPQAWQGAYGGRVHSEALASAQGLEHAVLHEEGLASAMSDLSCAICTVDMTGAASAASIARSRSATARLTASLTSAAAQRQYLQREAPSCRWGWLR